MIFQTLERFVANGIGSDEMLSPTRGEMFIATKLNKNLSSFRSGTIENHYSMRLKNTLRQEGRIEPKSVFKNLLRYIVGCFAPNGAQESFPASVL
jgi:hypothetical protein